MTSRANADFWRCYTRLPEHLRRSADEKYRLWRDDPFHPSLHFKELVPDLWSVRISRSCRALGRRSGDAVVWFWIGTHEEYDRLIARQ